jgi:hypothetical protein
LAGLFNGVDNAGAIRFRATTESTENSQMHHSVLFSATLALLPFAGQLLASDSTVTEAKAPMATEIIKSTPIAAPVGWWNTLGTDSLPYDSLQRIPVNIGTMPTMDANGKNPGKVANSLSLATVSSEAGAIRGLQASLAMNDVHGSVRGVQVTGGLNLVGGNVVGVQGGGLNLVKGNVSGLQYASVFNRVGGNFSGVQFGVIGNVAEGEVVGVQTGSGVNRALSIKGIQDGIANIACQAKGVQSGMINVANTIEGVQFGLINIAKHMTGPQIGLVNIRPDSRVFVESWTDETGLSHLGLNYGSPGWYNLFEFAGKSTDGNRFAFGWGFGGRLPAKRLILSTDLSALLVGDPDRLDQAEKSNPGSDSLTADHKDAINGLFRARATVGWHLWSRLAVFGGASWNILAIPEGGHGSRLLRPYESYHWDANNHVRMWPGVFLGIRI